MHSHGFGCSAPDCLSRFAKMHEDWCEGKKTGNERGKIGFS